MKAPECWVRERALHTQTHRHTDTHCAAHTDTQTHSLTHASALRDPGSFSVPPVCFSVWPYSSSHVLKSHTQHLHTHTRACTHSSIHTHTHACPHSSVHTHVCLQAMRVTSHLWSTYSNHTFAITSANATSSASAP